MAWSIAWTPPALRELRKLASSDQQRIMSKLEESTRDPKRYYTKLVGEDTYRLRVGDLRVIVLIMFVGETIEVQAVRHRSVAYR